jgi:hypothetical protein
MNFVHDFPFFLLPEYPTVYIALGVSLVWKLLFWVLLFFRHWLWSLPPQFFSRYVFGLAATVVAVYHALVVNPVGVAAVAPHVV